MEFRQRLKELRQRTGWTQYQLAQVSGVPRQVIARLESGERQSENMTVGVAKKLARVLGVSVDHFIGMYEEESKLQPAPSVTRPREDAHETKPTTKRQRPRKAAPVA